MIKVGISGKIASGKSEVEHIISNLGYKTWIINTFLSGGESFTEYIKFTGIYSLSVFVICCIVSLNRLRIHLYPECRD